MATKEMASFRFYSATIKQLDYLVNLERGKGQTLTPAMQANRTSVIESLIEAEYIRRQEEEARIVEQLGKVSIDAQELRPRRKNGRTKKRAGHRGQRLARRPTITIEKPVDSLATVQD